jgi:predicted AAA+ superfamily ATPase
MTLLAKFADKGPLRMELKRYLYDSIEEDLKKRMVFIGGPRQVGKTTFSLQLVGASDKKHPSYLNWDFIKDKKNIRQGDLPFAEPLIILDEIHKFKAWRGLIKGLYDKTFPSNNYIVTGSARLDFYRHGGDSLQGRYHYYRLHPLSLGELSKNPTTEHLSALLKFGGYPEPFYAADERFLRRWQNEYFERVIEDDIADLETVSDISKLSLLIDELPKKVGGILSVKSLREDLEVAHATAERWIQILERLYVCYRIPPFSPPKIRAVKKEQKLYLWDWSHVQDGGDRFENLVASQLLKFCHYQEDVEGHKMELRFLRDIDKREIDFVVLQKGKPIFAVEVKSGEKNLSTHIPYFAARTKIPLFYQVHQGIADKNYNDVRARILPWITFCRELEMP